MLLGVNQVGMAALVPLERTPGTEPPSIRKIEAERLRSMRVEEFRGNAAEWDSTGVARGASALDETKGSCGEKRVVTPASSIGDIGFRCCADSLAPVGPAR